MSSVWPILSPALTFLGFQSVSWLSYIHPDEFFQSFQPLLNDNVPWEFVHACRSVVPLKLIQFILSLSKPPYTASIYLIVKMVYFGASYFAVYFSINSLLPSLQHRQTALVIVSTSYITYVYQSHTFSNSLETTLLLPTVVIVDGMRNNRSSVAKSFVLGLLVALGVFNRVTFVSWLLVPSVFALKYFLNHWGHLLAALTSLIAFSSIFIAIDSEYFAGSAKTLVITPLNSLLYNTKISNLAQHGLHPYYQHVLVNYPLILGPLVLTAFPFNTEHIKSTPFIAMVSGVLVHSLVPHQELRFLVPMVPLWACCAKFSKAQLFKFPYILWIPFNTAMLVFMGKFHQGGVVPAMFELQNYTENLVFWRTYKPPTWIIHNRDRQFANKDDPMFWDTIKTIKSPFLVDCMGLEYQGFESAVQQLLSANEHLLLVAPQNAMLNVQNKTIQYREIWSYPWHYDMDHFEFETYGWSTFKPGIGIFNVTAYL
ncbi:hypothetical protein OGAPHI_000972 [Ogataea philodendri]|uniref:Mannosyltransferase n=1 Tax=Ogataea philodendri TaxID=1378263 RepID=A0A9P8PED2_9ASCO|nr:uncharacterized protein OGAPHI_000972 [Ogataea philodendri]KAH3670457.1 hypothetical protein OGAPHI_000972 [Ogataea philodendri]